MVFVSGRILATEFHCQHFYVIPQWIPGIASEFLSLCTSPRLFWIFFLVWKSYLYVTFCIHAYSWKWLVNLVKTCPKNKHSKWKILSSLSPSSIQVLLYIYMGHWEQDGKNVNYMARIFFRNRFDTTIVSIGMR